MGGSGRRQTPNTCPEGHVSGVPGGERGGDVFDKGGRAANVSNTKNAPLWARLWYLTQRKGQGTCRTPKTFPQGHVHGVQHEGKGRKCAEHYEHAHKGMFIVFSVRGTAENMSNIKNMPARACSWCPTREEWRERTKHDEHALVGMFVVFDVRRRESTRQTSVWCSRRPKGEEDTSYTPNRPTRACLWCSR